MKYLIIILILLNSCAANRQIYNENYKVLDAYLIQHKLDTIIVANKSLNLTKPPTYFFSRHLDFSSRFVKNKTKMLFDNVEIEYLKEHYTEWKKFDWVHDNISTQKTLIISDHSNLSNRIGRKTYWFSEPFYNYKKNKALIIVKSDYIGSIHSDIYIIGFIKKGNNWKFFDNIMY